MDSITKEIFLETVFPPDMLAPGTLPVVAYPDSFIDRAGQQVEYYRQFHPTARAMRSARSWYFCVSSIAHQRSRQVKKRLSDVREAFVLVVDDVGTKSNPPPVAPSYILETSENNFQFGYLLEPFDVSTPEGRLVYDSVLYSLAEAGMNDPGFRSASRLARLPGSVHRTGFRAQITSWEPDRSWHLDDLFDRMGVPLVEPSAGGAREQVAGQHTRLTDVRDAVYDMLVAERMVLGSNAQWVHIQCPWREEHTDGRQGYSSTSYSPEEYGTAGRAFKCLHGHCAGRTTADFVTWAMQHHARHLFSGVPS